MLLQTFSKVLLVVDYQANKEYIMEFLCINRDKPELECEGKCHLAKNLKKQEDAEKNSKEQQVSLEVQINLFCQWWLSYQFVGFKSESALYSNYEASHTTQAFFAIFHPPKRLV